MITARIQYTVNPEYSAHNKENIARVTAELKALDRPDVRYAVFVENDGITFHHLYMCADGDARKLILGLESFIKFRTELQASNPELLPVATDLGLVASSYDLF
jgi:hypothetical protein